jgi:hypothetical protein
MQMESWVEAYGHAWQTRDPEAAASLFTPEATYAWGPFGEPLRGREAIRQAWAEATSTQEGIQFGYELLAAIDERGIFRWWSSFREPARNVRVELEGIFLLTFAEDGLCSSLREWFNVREVSS